MGKGERKDNNERRSQITPLSFRRFVKTTISDLGHADYSAYSIGILFPPSGEKRNLKKLISSISSKRIVLDYSLCYIFFNNNW
jgi:hypothetical protein